MNSKILMRFVNNQIIRHENKIVKGNEDKDR
jgi:hypothetical protein